MSKLAKSQDAAEQSRTGRVTNGGAVRPVTRGRLAICKKIRPHKAALSLLRKGSGTPPRKRALG